MVAQKKFALGRGLDALIAKEEVKTQGSSLINEIPIHKIVANPNQPRKEFEENSLLELAESIKQLGIVQPITLRAMDDGTYQIIAGERRWRASQLLGLTKLPAYIRTANDENMMQMALVENIQREDLNAIEVALAYQQLIEKYHLTQEQLSDKVGKNRATIANYIRLLKLPSAIQMAIQNKIIDHGHARPLLSLDSPSLQMKIFKEIEGKGLSVRQIEDLVAKAKENGEVQSGGGRRKALPEEYNLLKKRLSSFFSTRVQLTRGTTGKGKISIPFSSEEDLERIMRIFDKMQ